ncbi:MAG: HTH domain-containing protein [Deltaproteobacteria bacterium]|nr:HTH domain-containing protein [Deltaproteobacteria bacterium]
MKRQTRLFALAELLRGRRTGVTAEQLAERFGVTVRTIYRDLDALRDAAFPLHAERGRGGGFALDRSYTLPPVNFTPTEAAILVALGRWAQEMRFLPFVDTLAAALDKVRGALSTASQRELVEQAEKLRFVGIPALPVAAPVRRVVEEAWLHRRPVRVRYQDKHGAVAWRRVRVLGLLMERAATFLECHDLDKDEPRTLRLDRVVGATFDDAADDGPAAR